MDKEGLKNKPSPWQSHTWEGGGPAEGYKREQGKGSEWFGLCRGEGAVAATKKKQRFYNPPFCKKGNCAK